MPIISIIVPVYNVESYLPRCLDSVLGQTFTDWECVLVDDTSPDNCPAICDEYTARDGRFRVIHKKENGGLSLARNDGLDAAYGEYVFFLDSDDFIADYAMERLLRFAEKNNLDFAEGRTLLYYGNNSTKDIAFVDCGDSGEIILCTRNEIYHFYLAVYKQINAWNKLIKRNFIIQNNIHFIKGLVSEDSLWLYLSVLPNVCRAGFIRDATYYYDKSIQGTTLTNGFSENHITSYIFIIRQLLSDKVIYHYLIETNNGIISHYVLSGFWKLGTGNFSLEKTRSYIIEYKSILHTDIFTRYFRNTKTRDSWKIALYMYGSPFFSTIITKLYGKFVSARIRLVKVIKSIVCP